MAYSLQLLVLVNIFSSGLGNNLDGLNVLAHWALNGSEPGLTLHDNSPKFVEGRLPGTKAIQFNQELSSAIIPGVDLLNRTFTVAIWVKFYKILRSLEQGIICDWFHPNYKWKLATLYGEYMFNRRSINAKNHLTLWNASSIQTHKWYHLAVTWDDTTSTFKLFLNGRHLVSNSVHHGITWYHDSDRLRLGHASSYGIHRQFFGEAMDLYIIDGAMNSKQLNNLRGFLEIVPSFLNNTSVAVFQNESVTCSARGSPTPYVAWIYSGKVLVNKTSSVQTAVQKEGQYTCMASNREGTKWLIINLSMRPCLLGSSYKMRYSDTIDNHAIVGPLLKSITANDDKDCKDACFLHVPDVCYMFNYFPNTKKCELFYKDKVSEYNVEKRNGCFFRTRECHGNPCIDGKRCYSLGDSSHTSCI